MNDSRIDWGRLLGAAVLNWFGVALALVLVAGCATADKKPLVTGPTTIQPPANPSVRTTEGSLFTEVGTPSVGRFVPLFSNIRARVIGDIVEVRLVERTAANRSSNASAQKSSEISVEANLDSLATLGSAIPGGGLVGKRAAALGQSVNGITAESGIEYQGRGSSNALNTFSGTLTATVVEVLANGNLVVAGEKQIAVGSDEEVIRLSGVVNPADLVNDTISSTRLADLRLEYRGRGAGDDTQSPGWLSRFLLKVSPF